MIGKPPGTWRVLGLLARSAMLRHLRAMQIARSMRRQRQGAGSSRRVATPRKGGRGAALLMLLMLPFLMFSALQTTARGTNNLADATATGASGAEPMAVGVQTYYRISLVDYAERLHPGDADAKEKALTELRQWLGNRAEAEATIERYRAYGLAGFKHRELHGMVLADTRSLSADDRAGLGKSGALLLLALTVMLVCIGLGGANLDLGRPEWSFPWLLTFPVPTQAIVLGKVAEYSLVNFFPWFTVFPLTWQLLRVGGGSDQVWPLAIAATLATATLAGSLRFLVETWLRLRLPLQRVRSVQGLCTLCGISGMAVTFSVVMPTATPRWFVAVADAAPTWLTMCGTAWPMALLTHGWLASLVGLAGVLGTIAVATFAAVSLLRGGSERTAGVDAGDRSRRRGAGRRLTVLGKDLLLLARDRNFAVQTLVVPMFILGLQLFFNPGASEAAASGQTIVLAYVIGTMALTGGCFAVLSYEGRALWLLYCQPVELQAALRQKVLLWAGIACAFTLVALVVIGTLRPTELSLGRRVIDACWVLAGVFSAAWLAAGVGALGTDAAADHVPKQPRPRYVYLYLYLAGSYCLGLASDQWSVRAAALLVFGTLAWSLWQRVGDRLPWLLDPAVPGRREISAYDAGAAVTTFFLLQGLIVVISAFGGDAPTGLTLLVSYALAGLLTVLVFGLVLIGRGLPVRDHLGLTTTNCRTPLLGTLLAAIAGVGLGCLGIAWRGLVVQNRWFDMPPEATGSMDLTMTLLLACVAAPLCEEVLFRGLLFQGLRRSTRPAIAVVWSALLFAVVHPMAGWPPVFLLGCATALVFQRTRFLPAAMVLHAAYNLVVVTTS